MGAEFPGAQLPLVVHSLHHLCRLQWVDCAPRCAGQGSAPVVVPGVPYTDLEGSLHAWGPRSLLAASISEQGPTLSTYNPQQQV